jgi:hypothetical protein
VRNVPVDEARRELEQVATFAPLGTDGVWSLRVR